MGADAVGLGSGRVWHVADACVRQGVEGRGRRGQAGGEGSVARVDAAILVSIVVSIPACHAGDRGSIPRRGGKTPFLVAGVAALSKRLPLGPFFSSLQRPTRGAGRPRVSGLPAVDHRHPFPLLAAPPPPAGARAGPPQPSQGA